MRRPHACLEIGGSPSPLRRRSPFSSSSISRSTAAKLAFLFKLYLALYTQGTLDAAASADHLAKIEALGGVGAYRVSGAFNNPFNSPPFIIHFLKALGWLAHSTALPFAFWLRLPCILADACSLLLVWKLLARSPASHLHAPLPRLGIDAPSNIAVPRRNAPATPPHRARAMRRCCSSRSRSRPSPSSFRAFTATLIRS